MSANSTTYDSNLPSFNDLQRIDFLRVFVKFYLDDFATKKYRYPENVFGKSNSYQQ